MHIANENNFLNRIILAQLNACKYKYIWEKYAKILKGNALEANIENMRSSQEKQKFRYR